MNKSVYILILLIFFGGIFLWDMQNRNSISVDCKSKKDLQYFYGSENIDSIKKKFSQNFKNPRYTYPGSRVEKITVSQNTPVFGRFLSKELSAKQTKEFVNFLNNPDNFTWKTTNMHYTDADYIFRLYDLDGKEIGKIWFCIKCHQLKIIPFSPNYKFGYLKPDKTKKLLQIIADN